MTRHTAPHHATQRHTLPYPAVPHPPWRVRYDDHRESILRGDEGDDGLVGDGMDLMCYFSPSCFRGYNDDETGFYTVYAKVCSHTPTDLLLGLPVPAQLPHGHCWQCSLTPTTFSPIGLSQVFEEIWENELYVVDGEDPPPPFGASASDYVDVAKVFYRYWTG
jgi:hypothetical protein